MPGRKPSEWSVKFDELEKTLPKDFDARSFKKCRVNGEWDKSKIVQACESKGFKDKADAVFAFLVHKDTKVKSSGKKRGPKQSAAINQSTVNLLAKRTYSVLSASDIGKVIVMLGEIQKSRKEEEIAELKAKMAELSKQLKELGVVK
jgi:hypothetical protein